jgi:hypothetical protein
MRVIFLIGALCALGACKESCEQLAYEAVQDEILKSVKSPATAIFPEIEKTTMTPHDFLDCSPEFVGYLDAQNSFGALVRMDYRAATVLHPDTGYDVVVFEIKQR